MLDVNKWNLADKPIVVGFARFWTKADKFGYWASDGLTAYDPKRTLRLSRMYDAERIIVSSLSAKFP